jgi:hypothetical protein
MSRDYYTRSNKYVSNKYFFLHTRHEMCVPSIAPMQFFILKNQKMICLEIGMDRFG